MDPIATCPRCGQPAPATGCERCPPEPPAVTEVTVGPTAERPPPVGRDEVPARLGRFELLGPLGAGGFGTVYRALDPALDREVAVKVFRASAAGPEQEAAFRREARAASGLRHPNIVAVFETGQDAGRGFLVAALIRGRTLRAALDAAGGDGLPLATAARYARQLAGALAYAHRSGVVHRDVKPANVLLDDADEPLLADFGLAARGDEAAGRRGGTPAYMAPEQARGDAGPASDQYALGCTLFEMLTGRTPFAGPADLQRFLHDTQPAPSPRAVRPAVPRDLDAICRRCLEKEPGRRYPSCQPLADDLRRWLDGEPVSVRPRGPLERAARWVRRNPTVAALGGLTAALAAGVFAVTLYSRAQIRQRQEEAEESAAVALTYAERAFETIDETMTFAAADVLDREPVQEEQRRRLLKQARDKYAQLAEIAPDRLPADRRAQFRRRIAVAERRIADFNLQLGEYQEAEGRYGRAIERLTELTPPEEADPELRDQLIHCHNFRGVALFHLKRLADAGGTYARAEELVGAARAAEPQNWKLRLDLVRVRYNRALVEAQQLRDAPEAPDVLAAWQALVERLGAIEGLFGGLPPPDQLPPGDRFRYHLERGRVHHNRAAAWGMVAAAPGNPDPRAADAAAAAGYADAVAALKQAIAADNRPWVRKEQHEAQALGANHLWYAGQRPEAERAWRAAHAGLKRLRQDFPANRAVAVSLARTAAMLGNGLAELGDRGQHDEAVALLNEALAEYGGLPEGELAKQDQEVRDWVRAKLAQIGP